MRLRPFATASRRRPQIDDIGAAYSAWSLECAAVRVAYGTWACAATRDAWLAFVAYCVALDREEHAADAYARLLPRAQRRSELEVTRPLTRLTAPFGAS